MVENHVFGIGPVVTQSFPNAGRALCDIGVIRAFLMDLQILIGGIAKEFLAARSEVGEPCDELLGRRAGCLV